MNRFDGMTGAEVLGLIIAALLAEAARDLAAGWLVQGGLSSVGVHFGFWRCAVLTFTFALAFELVTYKSKESKA